MARGQATIEGILALIFLVVIGVFCLETSFHSLVRLLLIRAAAEHSRCIAQNIPNQKCQSIIQKKLSDHYALKKITISYKSVRQTIHTEIKAQLLNSYFIIGQFDLWPSEYKRISK